MLSYEECLALVKKEIKNHLPSKNPVRLYDPIRYMMSLGGKRIRPCMLLMGCNIFSDDIKRALYPAIAVEMFHNFTLVHDDIMDKSDTRRNKPTVHKKWNENIAILSGDAMIIKTYEILNKSNPENLSQIIQVFNSTALKVCEGQQYDMDFEQENIVTEKEYLKMIELKTAELIAGSLMIGAIAGGATYEHAKILYSFGKNAGMAFQLQDDLLDVYGSKKFGKKTGNDIVANKKTYLMIKAFSLAGKQDLKILKIWLGKKNFKRKEKIKAVREIYDKLNIPEITEKKIQEYYNKALRTLKNIPVEESRKIYLAALADKLMDRDV